MKKIILILLLLLLSGCYDYNELNELGIVSTMFIDYKDEEFVTTLEILNTNESSKEVSYMFNGSGSTIESSINNCFSNAFLIPYYSHMYTVIISEDIAKDKLESLYDYFTRDVDYRKDFYILISDDINGIIKYEPKNKLSIGENIKKIIENSENKNAKYIVNNYREILDNYLNNNNYVLGSIQIDDDNLTLKDNYLISNNKLELKLDEKAILFMNVLNNYSSSFQIDSQDSFDTYEYKIDAKVHKNKIEISLTGNARILNLNSENTKTDVNISNIEKELETYVKDYFCKCLEYAKNLNKDIYNFNFLYYKYYPNSVNENTWKTIDYDIKVDLKINEKGLIFDSVGEEAYEN